MKKTKFKKTEIGMIPEDWEVKRIGDEIELCYGKGLPETKRIKGKIPVYGSNGIVGFHNESLINGQGIIIGRKGSVGEIKFSERDFWAIDTTYYVKLLKKGDIKFWYYFLLTLKLNKMNSHSAVPGLNRDNVYEIVEKIPDFEEQQKISKILSDLDSKIELNHQMNKTLEATGQAIFKRWFIDFEFPNEKGKPYKSSGGEMVDSELGEIPKGWKVSKIGKEFETILGGTPRTTNKSYWENGTVAWINSGEINKFRIIEPTAHITKEAVDNSATKLMPKGTTVLAITGATLGQVSRIEIDTCANQSVIGIIENKDIPSEYIYLWIKHKIIGLISNQTGVAQQHINKNNVNELEILLPDDSLMLKFKEMMRSIFKNISINCFESQNLSQIRDSLLPKLMSGKIRVPVEVSA